MVRLRPFKRSDFKHLLNWMTDEASFIKWSAGKFDYPLTHRQLEDYYDTYEQDEFAWIIIALDEKGEPVGHLMMRKANYTDNSIHFGFIIVDPSQRGKGYGREMVQLSINYAVNLLQMSKVTLSVFDNNPTAHQCYLGIGFKDLEYRKEVFPVQNEKWGLFDMAYNK